MADKFRLATEAQDAELKAYARHFEHRGEEDESPRRAVLYVIATVSFPDSGWNLRIEPIEGTDQQEWVLLEDPPGFRDTDRSYLIACGSTEREVEAVPKTIVVKHHDQTTRVSVVPWD